ncbi:MAG: hypothetical protein K0R29_1975 [Pseudobdellovibrio sp.]|jgi:hypothetical protein|nr:hypothetical protein [Pseudobdellovibrio sp.]
MNLFRNFCYLTAVTFASIHCYSEPASSPPAEVVNIQNIEFEVSNTTGGWISTGSEQNPQFLKSISIKYKFKEGVIAPTAAAENSLRDAVKRAAEEKCRLIGASDRPAELSASVQLRMIADISSQQITFTNQEFNGKYVCAVNLKQ